MALKLSLRSRGKNGDTKHKDGEVTMKTCFWEKDEKFTFKDNI